MEQLFTHALGLVPPWVVISVDFRETDGAIYFAVEWQHLHFFQFRAFIDARLPREACDHSCPARAA